MREANAIAPRVFYAGPLLDGRDVVYDGESRPHIGVQNINTQSAQDRVEFLKTKHQVGITPQNQVAILPDGYIHA